MGTRNDHDRGLDAAIADYLTRLDSGETPDQDEYLAQHPEVAQDLQRFFDDLAFVDRQLAEEKATLRDVGLGRWFRSRDPSENSHADASAPSPDLPQIRGFRVLQEVGGGSQGVVYKAVQLGTKRTVALKVIREGAFATRAERLRFENEVELASRLSHPNIVAIYSCGQDSGRDYFAMEYVDGEPLDAYLATRTLDIPGTLELFLQICDAITFAHLYGIIHRDIKPGNVTVDASGRVRILDFGLAKAELPSAGRGDIARTQPGEFAGTWYYASPEQAKKDPQLVDVRSDVYALGVILYEMLTDCLPYPIQDESQDVIARHIVETPPARPSAIRRDIDDDLDTIVLRALAKETERRYQSVAALGEDLRRYLRGEAIEAKRDSAWYVLRRFTARNRWKVGAASVALAALTVFSVIVSILYSRARIAQATTEARSRVVRESQRYLMDKVDELNWADNRLAEIVAAHPDLPEMRLMRKVLSEEPVAVFSAVVEDMPDGLVDSVSDPDRADYETGVQWLMAHEDDLARIVELSQTTRFRFRMKESSSADLAFYDDYGSFGHAPKVCDALLASALQAHREAQHDVAVSSLDAARSIAVDLGDTPGLLHRGLSVSMRSRMYDALLTVLEETRGGPEVLNEYIRWAQRDPPIVQYRTAMVAERHRRSQLVELAVVGRRPGDTGVINLPTLELHTRELRQNLPESPAERQALARSVSPQQMLEVIDVYYREAEQWDHLTLAELHARRDHIANELRAKPALALCRPLLSDCATAFRHRGRVKCKRAATILAACAFDYRQNSNRWPERLADAIPNGLSIKVTDPYIGVPLGYSVEDNAVRIYSVNEDGEDNGGRPGGWGQPGTDVVFFEAISRESGPARPR